MPQELTGGFETGGRRSSEAGFERTRLPQWQEAVLFGIAYFACAEASRLLSAGGRADISFWLPCGLYVAVLLLNDCKAWPWLVLAATAANVTFDAMMGTPALGILQFILANTLAALTGAWLVRRFVARRPTMATLREFAGFLVFAGLLGTFVGALISATGQVLLGMSRTFVKTCGILWGSDMLTTLIVAPFVLTWFPELPNWRAMIAQPRKLLEGAVLLAGTITALWWVLVAGQGINSPNKSPLLIFALWAGLRFGVRGVAAFNFLVGLLAGFFTQHYLKGLASADLASHGYVLTLEVVLAMGTIAGLIPAIIVAELDKTLKALRKSEDRFRTLSNASLEGIMIHDQGMILDVNLAFTRLFGYGQPEELVGKQGIELLLTPESQARIRQRLQRQETGSLEVTAVRKDGGTFAAGIESQVLRYNDRDARITSCRDITGRKQAEEELQLQSRLQELLMKMSANYINLPWEAVESAIRASLGELGEFVGADSATVFNYDFKRNFADMTCEWLREGIKPQFADFQALSLAASPDWDLDAHRRGEPIFIADVRSLLPGALKDLLNAGGVKSVLAIPLMSFGRCFGFVSFDWTRSLHEWSGKEQYLLQFFAHILVNIQQRKEAEEALQQSERNYREIYNAANDAIFVQDADTGAILDVNESMLRLYGYSREEALRLTCNDGSLGASPYSEAEARQWRAKTVAEGPQMFEWHARKKSGELFWVEVALKIATINGRRRILAIVHDITERKRAEKRLQTSREQLRALSSRLQSLREGDRTALAREIHDHLGQLLTALNLDLRLIEHRAANVAEPGLRDALCGKIKAARVLANEAITSVQKIATELRPAILDRLGLEAAMEVEARAFQSRTGVKCQWTLPSTPLALAPDQATIIFRIFQEILTNVARHAHAANVAVRLTQDNNLVLLKVSDNGVGIRPAEIANPASLGLLGMSERAAILGGKIAFGPNVPRGTTVAVQIPLHGKAGQTL
jgi:PAS domain S-box-containing protein